MLGRWTFLSVLWCALAAAGVGPAAGHLEHNPSNWLTTDVYDNNGSTRTNGADTFQYDVEGRLTNATVGGTTVTYTYNADGIRVSKTTGGVTTLYLVDDRNPTGYAQVLEELTVSGGTTNLSKVYTYGLDLLSQSTINPQRTTVFYGYDGNGSTRYLTTTNAALANVFVYDAFGTLIASNAAPQTDYLFTGEQRDPHLGLYYLRARYLNAGTGRFWTRDTHPGNNHEPISLHKYLYCAANPVNMVDPSGHEFNFIGLMTSMKTMTVLAVNVGIRAAPAANRITVILFEAATGNTVILGGGAVVGTAAAMSKIPGGINAWSRLAQALKGSIVGPYQAVRNVLAHSGRDAHHINPTAIYPNIPRNTGAAIDLIGGGTGSEHHVFHAVMNRFFEQFRPGGAFAGQGPTNRQVREAMREAYEATGRFLEDQIDELIEFAEKEQRAHGYFDGPGGLLPDIPKIN